MSTLTHPRRFWTKAVAIAALAATLLPPLAAAADKKSTLSIEVTNQFDKPVENATVILDFLGSHQIARLGMRKSTHWEVHTNQQGKAHFPAVPFGTVQVQVITSKYQTFGKKVDLDTEEKKLDVQLQPPQNQYSAHPALKPADPKN